MRKLWVNFLPGRDPVADMYFNFPQEVPKYLRGYYNIPSNMVGKMGALIFIANYGQNKELIKRIDKDNLEKLVPQGHKVIIVIRHTTQFYLQLFFSAQA